MHICARMVEGEMARVHTFVGRGKMQTIAQNDGDTVPIILSYSLQFSPTYKGVNACHFAPDRAWSKCAFSSAIPAIS